MKTILNYFQNKNIVINGCLRKDLEKRNWMALSYISYTIKNLVGIKGIEELLKEIAHLDFKTRNGRRIYHNSLQQFHAIYFVRNQLRYKILEVESRNHKIFSPYRDNIKSCDIKAQKNGKVYYFESKDSQDL